MPIHHPNANPSSTGESSRKVVGTLATRLFIGYASDADFDKSVISKTDEPPQMKVVYHKYSMRLHDLKLLESFANIDVKNLGIDQLVNQADAALEDPAAQAITDFVGVEPDARKHDTWGGIMQSRRLEDAYSSHPSEQGQIIRQQLTQAFEPVKAALKSKFGNTIQLYRAQLPVQNATPRHTLSWTSDPRIAAWVAGVAPADMRVRPISDQEIADALEKYHSTGILKWRQKKYVRTAQKTNDPNLDEYYYDIYDRDGNHITDGDDLEYDLRQDQEWYNEVIAKRDKKMQKVLAVSVPIDDIIWITDRAGQSEFILHNLPEKPAYVDITGKLLK